MTSFWDIRRCQSVRCRRLAEAAGAIAFKPSALDNNPDLQHCMVKRMVAKTIEIEASHLALISHRGAITNLILEALAV